MKNKDINKFYRRNLPHIQPIGGIFFVTFRLKNSIPKIWLDKLRLDHKDKIEELKSKSRKDSSLFIKKEKEQYFLKYDELLDTTKSGKHHLKNVGVANMVQKELHRFDGELYDLIAYCIMSNHVHILIDTTIQFPEKLLGEDSEDICLEPLQNIMKRIKGPTAIYANKILKRKGKFWQRESFDRLIRNAKELENTIGYILDNPVKAKIVEDWKNYPYSFYKYKTH